jgi:hypothetical protein
MYSSLGWNHKKAAANGRWQRLQSKLNTQAQGAARPLPGDRLVLADQRRPALRITFQLYGWYNLNIPFDALTKLP